MGTTISLSESDKLTFTFIYYLNSRTIEALLPNYYSVMKPGMLCRGGK